MTHQKVQVVKVTFNLFATTSHKFSIVDSRLMNVKIFGVHFHKSHSFDCYYITIDFFGFNIFIYLTKPNFGTR